MRISFPLRLAAVMAALPPFLGFSQHDQDEETGPRVVPNLHVQLEAWKARFGPGWRQHVDAATGHVEMLYGGSAPAEFLPRTDQEWVELARAFAAQAEPMHGIGAASLVHERSIFLPLSEVGTTDKIAVRFRQVVGGIPVEGARLNVLMDADNGMLLSLHSTCIPGIEAEDAAGLLGAAVATRVGEQIFQDSIGLPPSKVGAAELVFARVEEGDFRVGRLAWRMDLRRDHADALPDVWRYWIDAQSGELVAAESLVHHDVGGTVRANSSTGVLPDGGGNPPQQQLMRHLRVQSSAGTIHTDANGNFNYPGVNGPLSCTFTFVGTYANVTNSAGTEYSLVQSLTGTANAVVMNPTPSELLTSQANAFEGLVRLRNWIRSVNPADGTADFQALANVNINANCNAYFDGGSVNFYTTGGGCVNTAYSTVVAHEMGHWLNVLYGTGNGSDGIGEGNADVFAMYLYDNAIVGQNFCGSGCHIRTGENLRQFCGDTNPGCHGGVHNNGEVWMGAAWKVRKNLNTVHGNAAGDAIADALFSGWMNTYNQTQIRSIMETQWLTLDDNDGYIGNGTPNYSSIDSAFRTQGFPGVDLDPILIDTVTQLPNTENQTGPYVVNARVIANLNPPLQGTRVRYRVNGGSFVNVNMTPQGGNMFQAAIPGQTAPAEVQYYVEATDNIGVTRTFPANAPTSLLQFAIGVETIFFFNDFEGATNEGWQGGVAGDTATTGTWVRVDPNPTAAQPGDDHTPPPGILCWVTGQGSPGGAVGEADVDGGTTTLLSPVFSASGLFSPKISYWRWYSNNQGASPSTDTFLVQISNNGGSTWAAVETVGPSGPGTSGGWINYTFRIADVIPLTANMRLRFIAQDLGSGSIVEAAIDDIVGIDLGPVQNADCNGNGIPDEQDISNGTSQDCNGNAIPDECDLAGGGSTDCNSNGIPDECDADCNGNGTPDACDITNGTSTDVNSNGVPDDCECLSSTYCVGAPNSFGNGGEIAFSGTLSIGLNNLVLRASEVPPNRPGIFYYGPNQVQIPFGNGFRCVGGGVFRFPIVNSNGSGVATYAVNYNNPPLPAGQIDSGETWKFQYWYRDPAAGGANFNLSNALSLTFCD